MARNLAGAHRAPDFACTVQYSTVVLQMTVYVIRTRRRPNEQMDGRTDGRIALCGLHAGRIEELITRRQYVNKVAQVLPSPNLLVHSELSGLSLLHTVVSWFGLLGPSFYIGQSARFEKLLYSS